MIMNKRIEQNRAWTQQITATLRLLPLCKQRFFDVNPPIHNPQRCINPNVAIETRIEDAMSALSRSIIAAR